MSKELTHYGILRRSGRYPWGSGNNAEQRNKSFLGTVEDLKKQGLSETEIAKGLGISVAQLRAKKSIANAEKRKAEVAQALRLKDKGYSNVEIGRIMGKNESSIRNLLNPALQERFEITKTTADMLRERVEEKSYIDIGVGVERHIGISRTKLKTAVSMLEEEGYKVWYVPVEQLGTGKKTYVLTLAKPDSTYSEVYKNKDKIRMITDYSEDGGRSFLGLEPIRSVSSNRIKIRYAEEGGSDKDGVIELRRGVDDISLGNARYAQVRIGVDGTHFLKGMAMYSDDLPPGIDIIYNTNKSSSIPKERVFKEMKDDPDNPFGSTVRQKHYIDSNGKRQLSALNIVGFKEGSGEEGSWEKWSKTLSSQFLSKQTPALAERQLGLAYNIKKEEYDEIMSLTNPVVKKYLLAGSNGLGGFAADCDAAAVHLKAAALPRQGSYVILPLPSLKEDQIYAPNYRDGETVVLVRHPHGGTFEIPELKVNNRNPDGRKLLGPVKDAVGINPKVAEQLSGADFDGDTVLVIPNQNKLIQTSPRLKSLKDFDPKISYKPYDGMKTINGGVYNEKTGKVEYGGKKPKTQNKQKQMGDISNLITDMTIKGANFDEIARAVRHSMVVIDSEKHALNYKQSYIDNGIPSLKKKYQGGERKGASTLISKSSSDERIGIRKEKVDKETGKKIYEYTNETYVDKNGKVHLRTTRSSKMAETDDAMTLSSGTVMEKVYADYANQLKQLANQARKEAMNTPGLTYSQSARETYKNEVASLNAKLNVSLKNAPLERQAQIIAGSVIKLKKEANPDMDPSDLKKIKNQAQMEARNRVGAKKELISITDKEWEAIQAGAISNNMLMQILQNSDLDEVKKLATPRSSSPLSPAKIESAKQKLKNGYTMAEVADTLGVSINVLTKAINN